MSKRKDLVAEGSQRLDKNLDTLEKYQAYIEDLYNVKSSLTRKDFINKTGWKEFVPVVDDDAARFLQLILQMKKPKHILEIGTSIGFSATSMALTAREYGGTITTIEFDNTAAVQARRNFERSGVDNIIEILFGDACQIVPSFSDDTFDFIFQDADKRLYPDLLKDCIRILKPGGVFVADDALFPVMELDPKWNNLVKPMSKFNRLVAEAPNLESTLLPIGDGMIVAIKK
ncbi:O-methyltransferase [Anaerocolumna sp. MB42-C2]|uniref:O-methyltransferase n=1 Tax=Anaerocolumna sp. MB42-C2 TaxID=3070997 RepID=UPI0027E0B4F1|nr:O-methyltransferase [Anaerocolumna sp. MB42-C2]WMJ90432.1 O-methyltransferase [Anaerocolumna sp. MB42-C2]